MGRKTRARRHTTWVADETAAQCLCECGLLLDFASRAGKVLVPDLIVSALSTGARNELNAALKSGTRYVECVEVRWGTRISGAMRHLVGDAPGLSLPQYATLASCKARRPRHLLTQDEVVLRHAERIIPGRCHLIKDVVEGLRRERRLERAEYRAWRVLVS